MANENLMSFITGVHFTKGMLKVLNSMTFLFDNNWNYGNSETATLPVTFFHIKSIHETMSAKVSQKPMLFFNSARSTTNDSTAGGLINVVADNIVIEPKRYRMDIIVPATDLTLLTNNYVLNQYQLNGITTFLNTKRDVDTHNAIALSISTAINNPYVAVIKTLLRQLLLADYSTTSNLMNSIMTSPEYNKNSLEAMFRNRTVLKLKLWNGWKYKYVVITDLDISKEPDEEGVYEATLTVQEVPIMTIRDTAGLKKQAYTNAMLESSIQLVKNIVNAKEEK